MDIMKKLKSILQVAYVKLRFHWWKVKIFANINDPRVKRLVSDEIYHRRLMDAVCAQLDRLPPHNPKHDDDTLYVGSLFVGVIPHDWESRIEDRIKRKVP